MVLKRCAHLNDLMVQQIWSVRSVYGCEPSRDGTWHLDNILVQEETEHRCPEEGGAQYGVLYGAW